MPGFVDHVIVVDDGSRDATAAIVAGVGREGLLLLRHGRNRGVGAAIASGYREALRRGAAAVAVMAGDGQMDAADLTALLDPVLGGQADYAKGNRFRHPSIWREMPWTRVLGNVVLSLLTKLSSGYWHVFDSQCGYTSVSRAALEAIDCRFFARYGYPNDLLARLRVVRARVVDVPVRPICARSALGDSAPGRWSTRCSSCCWPRGFGGCCRSGAGRGLSPAPVAERPLAERCASGY
ncbi:MAG: glycosyltransferase family 2 protein [Proteobacteria bacterium]|nr:glycosyltransferase family 2 protein [Pseudomonadota bacterium]